MSVTASRKMVDGVSAWFRARRAGHLRSFLLGTKSLSGPTRVLDLGGRGSFWEALGLDFLRANDITVTILNLTNNELYRRSDGGGVLTFIVGDACDTGMADNSYDIVLSNSVIEHLLTWENVKKFAGETRRLAPHYYCQTPNFWFPIDPHFYKVPFFHLLPRPTRAWLLRSFPLATAGRVGSVLASYDVADSARLLTRTQMRALFPDATLHAERVLGTAAKSYIAIR